MNNETFMQNKAGEFLWLYNFKGGGFNDVWALTLEEAYTKAYSGAAKSTFRKATRETWAEQDRLGYSMTC